MGEERIIILLLFCVCVVLTALVLKLNSEVEFNTERLNRHFKILENHTEFNTQVTLHILDKEIH